MLNRLPGINSGWWAAMCSRSQQTPRYFSTHPHPGGFSIAEYSPPPLLPLISFSGVHLIPVVPLRSYGLLFSALTQQWLSSPRCVCPYLAPRLRSILSLLGTRTKYGLEIPSPTKFWTSLSSLQHIVQCTLSSSTDRLLGGYVTAAEVTWLPWLDCDR